MNHSIPSHIQEETAQPNILTSLLPHKQGLELDEADQNPSANSAGFFPLLALLLDFPFPTIALLTGHTFGGAW